MKLVGLLVILGLFSTPSFSNDYQTRFSEVADTSAADDISTSDFVAGEKPSTRPIPFLDMIFTGYEGGAVRVTKKNGELIAVWPTVARWPDSVRVDRFYFLSNDVVAVKSRYGMGGEVQFRRIATGEVLASYTRVNTNGTAMDDKRIYIGDKVSLYAVDRGTLATSWETTLEPFHTTDNLKLLKSHIVVGFQHHVSLLNLETGKLLHSVKTRCYVNFLTFSPPSSITTEEGCATSDASPSWKEYHLYEVIGDRLIHIN